MKFLKYAAAFCTALMCAAVWAAPVSANSAQTYWSGTTATGTIVQDSSCPIVVEHEDLTLDLQEFPETYYRETSNFLAYSGNVTAAYTFYNPADYTVEATLSFPFGTLPDYGYWLNEQENQPALNEDTKRYQITVNDAPIEKVLRHTLSMRGDSFELERDMARLHDSFLEDPFYSPDLPVTCYTYVAKNVNLKEYPAATAAFVLSADPARSKVLMENQCGGSTLKDAVRLDCWVEPEKPFAVYVIGELLEKMPDWKFYENGACEKEITGTMELTGTRTLTLKELALSEYPENSGILEHDWYNAVIETMKLSEWAYGAISDFDMQLDVSNRLMRWYQYNITLKPGERMDNTVTAPLYPNMDLNYEPPVYEYTYLLSPAKSWKSFGTLDIAVNTPHYMTETALEGWTKTENGYACQLSGLPDTELTFTLSSEENPKKPMDTGYFAVYGSVILIAVLVIAIIAVPAIVLIVRKKKKQSK